jgi:hypothetical protein
MAVVEIQAKRELKEAWRGRELEFAAAVEPLENARRRWLLLFTLGLAPWKTNRKRIRPKRRRDPLGIVGIAAAAQPPLAIAPQLGSAPARANAHRGTETMSARLRMTSREFRESLVELKLTEKEWGQITGVRRQRVVRWCHDEERIPAWVPVLITALSTLGTTRGVLANLDQDALPAPSPPHGEGLNSREGKARP